MAPACARKNEPAGIRFAYACSTITMLAKFVPLRLSPATRFMNRRSGPALLLGLLACLLLTALPTRAAQLEANETLKLPTGRIAKILSVSKIEYSTGVMALMVRYQTTLSVDERSALSEEVDEVWKIAQGEVERQGHLHHRQPDDEFYF